MKTDSDDKLGRAGFNKDELSTLKRLASKYSGTWPRVVAITDGTVEPSDKIVVPKTKDHIAAEAAHEAAKAKVDKVMRKVYDQEQDYSADPKRWRGFTYTAPAREELGDAEAELGVSLRKLRREEALYGARWQAEYNRRNGIKAPKLEPSARVYPL